MQKHIIYIAADANRTYLEVDYCQDIALKSFEIQSFKTNFLSKTPKLTRIVYMEICDTFEMAQRRKTELVNYTKMQKDKLIRRKNPNWLSIIAINFSTNKKVAVNA